MAGRAYGDAEALRGIRSGHVGKATQVTQKRRSGRTTPRKDASTSVRSHTAAPRRPDGPQAVAGATGTDSSGLDSSGLDRPELDGAGRVAVWGMASIGFLVIVAAVVLFVIVGGIVGIIGGVVLAVVGALCGLLSWFLANPTRALDSLDARRRALEGQLGD